ncbi:hypothetical protein BgiBS90_020446 [Biomphalaria glabrata]|nr:hypothetical protein BgiBS90_020446 [Biomphalaria glabrata]
MLLLSSWILNSLSWCCKLFKSVISSSFGRYQLQLWEVSAPALGGISSSFASSDDEEDLVSSSIDVGSDESSESSNVSSVDLDFLSEDGDLLIDYHDIEESESGEADLHKRFLCCNKNPDHKGLIPLDEFSNNHIPNGDNLLYKCIQTIADLTVRVDVKMTSPRRPEFWPGSTKSYPFYKSNQSNLRAGSGWVSGVRQFTDDEKKCWCTKCQGSEFPSGAWWEVEVTTTRHLVFDTLEAGNTSLRFFYDKEDSLVVIIDKVIMENLGKDKCLLKFATCDSNLGDQLDRSQEKFASFWFKVYQKYLPARDEDKFSFIVSHPHGGCKRVSVGHWKEKKNEDELTRFTYTTCTCPGSSGALVLFPGYGNRFVPEFFHSGSLKSGLNVSVAELMYTQFF